jgi:hypothetical protein
MLKEKKTACKDLTESVNDLKHKIDVIKVHLDKKQAERARKGPPVVFTTQSDDNRRGKVK